MKVKVKVIGDWKKTEDFLKNAKDFDPLPILHKYGELGIDRLREATPVDTGLTAASWYYDIEKSKNGYTLHWLNSNVVNEWANVAVLIQYGHATVSGTYVPAVDYINPALKDVLDNLVSELRKEVSK